MPHRETEFLNGLVIPLTNVLKVLVIIIYIKLRKSNFKALNYYTLYRVVQKKVYDAI